MELFTEKEIKLKDLQAQKRAWKKELKNKDSKYSDGWILKQINSYEQDINKLKIGR